jgi:hypothetical protein
VTLDHFVMVRIHARQVIDSQSLATGHRIRKLTLCAIFAPLSDLMLLGEDSELADPAPAYLFRSAGVVAAGFDERLWISFLSSL